MLVRVLVVILRLGMGEKSSFPELMKSYLTVIPDLRCCCKSPGYEISGSLGVTPGERDQAVRGRKSRQFSHHPLN